MNIEQKTPYEIFQLLPDDLWLQIADFLDYPSLQKLPLFSKRFYKISQRLHEIIAKNPRVLDKRIEEIEAMAMSEFIILYELLKKDLVTFSDFIHTLPPTNILSDLLGFPNRRRIQAVEIINANRAETVAPIKIFTLERRVAYGLAIAFLACLGIEAVIAMNISSKDAQATLNIIGVITGAACLISFLTGITLTIKGNRALVNAVDGAPYNINSNDRIEEAKTHSDSDNQMGIDPLKDLTQALQRELRKITRRLEKISNTHFKFFDYKRNISIATHENILNISREMIKLIVMVHKEKSLFKKDILPNELIPIIDKYYNFLLENEKKLQEELGITKEELGIRVEKDTDSQDKEFEEKDPLMSDKSRTYSTGV